jgi:hypothetical protein
MLDLNPLTSLQEKQLNANEGSYAELKNLNSILANNNQTLIGFLNKDNTKIETQPTNTTNLNTTNNQNDHKTKKKLRRGSIPFQDKKRSTREKAKSGLLEVVALGLLKACVVSLNLLPKPQ